MEISFYHLTTSPLDRALPKLLEKAYSTGGRSVVFTANSELTNHLNTLLWTYDPGSFLPHGAPKEPHPESQPIFVTEETTAPNNATIALITDGRTLGADTTYTKILDLFDGNNETTLNAARQRWKQYKNNGATLTYFKQTESGAWEKQNV